MISDLATLFDDPEAALAVLGALDPKAAASLSGFAEALRLVANGGADVDASSPFDGDTFSDLDDDTFDDDPLDDVLDDPLDDDSLDEEALDDDGGPR